MSITRNSLFSMLSSSTTIFFDHVKAYFHVVYKVR